MLSVLQYRSVAFLVAFLLLPVSEIGLTIVLIVMNCRMHYCSKSDVSSAVHAHVVSLLLLDQIYIFQDNV